MCLYQFDLRTYLMKQTLLICTLLSLSKFTGPLQSIGNKSEFQKLVDERHGFMGFSFLFETILKWKILLFHNTQHLKGINIAISTRNQQTTSHKQRTWLPLFLIFTKTNALVIFNTLRVDKGTKIQRNHIDTISSNKKLY